MQNNFHSLFKEQQEWFEQLANQSKQIQKEHKYDTNKPQKKEKKQKEELDYIQIFQSTNILYVDCNNVQHKNSDWKQFRQGKKSVDNIVNVLHKWIENPMSKLVEIHLIWDSIKIQKVQEKIQEFDIFRNHQNLKVDQNWLSFIIMFNLQQISISIQSARPQWQIADDQIVSLCKNNQLTSRETCVVTSDKGLKDRLKEIGINKFVTNSQWWSLNL